MNKLIEFYGPPGSGKSTLANFTVSYLKNKGIKVVDRGTCLALGYKIWLSKTEKILYPKEKNLLEIAFKVLPENLEKKLINKSSLFIDTNEYKESLINDFILQNPGFYSLTLKTIQELYHLGKKEKGIDMLNWIKETFCIYQAAKNYIDDGIVILDGSFCMRLSTIHSQYSIKEKELPSDYTEKIADLATHISPKIDFSFFITAEPKICNLRQKKRGRIVGDEFDKQKRLKKLNERINHYEIIHQTLKKNGVSTFKIDNNHSIDQSKEKLSYYLDELIYSPI